MGTFTEEVTGTDWPLSVADVALVVVQVTNAVVGESSDAPIDAVGAAVLPVAVAVALAVAV